MGDSAMPCLLENADLATLCLNRWALTHFSGVPMVLSRYQ